MVEGNDFYLFDTMDRWNFCRFCRHLHSLTGKPTCNAFPEGIPAEILSGELIHKNPLPDQENAIVLTPW
jgi:hypothetical protein